MKESNDNEKMNNESNMKTEKKMTSEGETGQWWYCVVWS